MSAINEYLSGSDDPDSLARAAQEATGRGGIRRLRDAVSEGAPVCADVRARLAEYAQARDLELPLAPEWEEVSRHLAECAGCAAEYASIQALSRAGESDKLAGIPVPEPDLSFLPSPRAAASAAAWRWDDLGRLLVRFSEELVRAFAPPPALQPAFVTKGGEEGKVLVQFLLDDTLLSGAAVTITAFERTDEPALCWVVVEARGAGREWPDLGGTGVVLTIGPEQRAQTTDEWGRVVFRDVRVADLPRMAFEISPAE